MVTASIKDCLLRILSGTKSCCTTICGIRQVSPRILWILALRLRTEMLTEIPNLMMGKLTYFPLSVIEGRKQNNAE